MRRQVCLDERMKLKSIVGRGPVEGEPLQTCLYMGRHDRPSACIREVWPKVSTQGLDHTLSRVEGRGSARCQDRRKHKDTTNLD